MAIHIKSADEISLMKEAAEILIEAHELVAAHLTEGVY